MQTWQMVLLTNGEEPLVSDRAPEGARTRAIELEGSPIDDDELASSLYGLCAENHGHAGREYMRYVLGRLNGGPTKIKSDYEAWKKQIENVANDKIPAHLSALAVMCCADVYRQVSIHGVLEEDALDSTWAWAQEMLTGMASRGEGGELDREYSFLCDLVLSNRDHFADGPSVDKNPPRALVNPTWGFLYGGWAYIYPTVYRDQLEIANFRPKAASRRLGKAGLIKGEPHGNGVNMKWVRRVHGGMWIVLKLPVYE